EWVHVQLHQQKGMISLSPPTICNSAHAAMSVLGHGLLRGAGLGGPVGAALNGVKAVSGSAYRVTIPAVLQIACLRRMVSATQV
ncbi:hypothetical protein MP976_23745, partial [Escherichia coli]|nr:hypothetical protein [Escherichia coli]